MEFSAAYKLGQPSVPKDTTTCDKSAEETPRIKTQQKESDKKAADMYEVLDSSDVYSVVPDKSVRSRMILCFRVKGGDADAEKAFLKGAEEKHHSCTLHGACTW